MSLYLGCIADDFTGATPTGTWCYDGRCASRWRCTAVRYTIGRGKAATRAISMRD